MDALEKLKEIQKREGWTDQRMADEIGINRIYWAQLKAGTNKLTDSIKFKSWVRFYNEMNPIFMPSNLPKRKKKEVSQ